MIRRILCFLGFHDWFYIDMEDGTEKRFCRRWFCSK